MVEWSDTTCQRGNCISDTGVVRAGVLAGPVAQLPNETIAAADLLKQAGLDNRILLTPEKVIDASSYLDALARCQHASGDEHFMLRSGFGFPLEELGIAAQAGLQAQTLGDALSFVDAALAYFQTGSGLDISTVRGRCQVRYRQGLATGSDALYDLQYTLGVLAQFVGQTNHMHDPNLTIHYPNARSTLYVNWPSVPQFIDSTAGLLEFDARSLNARMSRGHDDKADILSIFMASNPIDIAFESSVSELCGRLLEATFEVKSPSAELIANMLGMNVRAFQRHLKTEGTTFRQVLEDTRKRTAVMELNKGARVVDIALMLGYEHPQNFTVAFDKWFGSTPSSMRINAETTIQSDI